jgi:cytochrome c-type biogenesis protein CcmF
MTALIGDFALILALCFATLQAAVPLLPIRRRDAALAAFTDNAAVAQFLLIALAFGCLTYAFVKSDFSLEVVAANSHTDKPLMYKISGVWGNHEGSMLLWVLILTVFGASVALFGQEIPDRLRSKTLAVHALIAAAFYVFILATSNPFWTLPDPPENGAGLNPILQDPGLAIHPPCLYLGYVGFSMAFSFAVAALIEGKVDASWARWVRPWVLAAWCFLTIGIALGSGWAYYTLGWGGWWFWDPVENASLMPWLSGTALLHSALVVERRNALASWTILLGILTFSLSLIGTFLVRSGVLTSVHAFAEDPARGAFILLMVTTFTGGAFALYAMRASKLRAGPSFSLISRESGLVLNNVLLCAALFTVILGTFYPLVIDAIGGDKISVGRPYYARTFIPLVAPLLIAVAIGPMLRWKRDTLRSALAKLTPAAVAAALVVVLVLALTFGRELAAAFFMGIAAWLVVGSLLALAQRVRLGEASLDTSLNLLRTLPRAYYGLVLGHLGVGVVVAGIAGVTTWGTEHIGALKVGQAFELSGYNLRLTAVQDVKGPNYDAQRALFDVTRNGRLVTHMQSERRFYPVRQQETTAAGIRTNLISNLYVAVGEQDSSGAWTVRFYYHPFMPWVWMGAFIMAFGGLVSLSDRRFRVGAAQRSARALPMPAGA